MKLSFLFVGSSKHGFVNDGVGEYVKRIKRYVPAEVTEVKAGGPGADDTGGAKRAEGERILKRLFAGDLVVALDERGDAFDTVGFSAFVGDALSGRFAGKQRVVFVVGGPYGLDRAVTERADKMLTLSGFTLAHGIARLVIAEQVYRALTILRNEPYSHGVRS